MKPYHQNLKNVCNLLFPWIEVKFFAIDRLYHITGTLRIENTFKNFESPKKLFLYPTHRLIILNSKLDWVLKNISHKCSKILHKTDSFDILIAVENYSVSQIKGKIKSLAKSVFVEVLGTSFIWDDDCPSKSKLGQKTSGNQLSVWRNRSKLLHVSSKHQFLTGSGLFSKLNHNLLLLLYGATVGLFST